MLTNRFEIHFMNYGKIEYLFQSPYKSIFQVPGNNSPASYLDQAHKEKALQSMQQMSSAQIVSASAMHKNYPMPLPTPYTTGGPFWNGIQTQE